MIRAACHHYSGKESRLEKVNKRVLIRGAKAETTSPAHPYRISSLTWTQYVRQKGKILFFDAVFDYLRYFERLYDEQGIVKSQHFAGINLVLSSILQEHKQSTATEDFAVFAKAVSYSPGQDRDKPIFHLFDKFCLLNSDYFDVQYFFTMALT